MARIVGHISRDSQFARAAQARSHAVLAQRMQGVANRAAQLAEQYADEFFDSTRPPDRRRPGRHLHGSFSGQVVSTSPGRPLEIAIRTQAPGVKVNALNSGSAPHKIRPKTATDLVFPGTKSFAGRRVVTKEVDHPGTRPTMFLDRAMFEAINEALGGAIRRSEVRRAAMTARAVRAARG
jgi:hypothetical protein